MCVCVCVCVCVCMPWKYKTLCAILVTMHFCNNFTHLVTTLYSGIQWYVQSRIQNNSLFITNISIKVNSQYYVYSNNNLKQGSSTF